MAAPYFFESKDFRAMIVSPCEAHLDNDLLFYFHSNF